MRAMVDCLRAAEERRFGLERERDVGIGGVATLRDLLATSRFRKGRWIRMRLARLKRGLLAAVRPLCGGLAFRGGITAALLLSIACTNQPVQGPRDVVLITIDTLRADFVGCYGGRADTPVLDGLARDGVRYSRAYSHVPVTGPSHLTMFSGILPSAHGVTINTQPVPDSVRYLPAALQDRGFDTAAFVSLGVLRERWGFGRGFSTYDEDFTGGFRYAREVLDRAAVFVAAPRSRPYFAWIHLSDPHEPYAAPGAHLPKVELTANGRSLGWFPADGKVREFLVDLRDGRAVVRVSSSGEEPGTEFMLRNLGVEPRGARLVAAHEGSGDSPTLPRAVRIARMPTAIAVEAAPEVARATLRIAVNERLSGARLIERYREEVEYTDRELGRFLEISRERWANRPPILVVTSDHGEALGEHGEVGHVNQLYETTLRVPLIVRGPGMAAGTTVDEVVGLRSIYSTLAAAAGLPLSDSDPGPLGLEPDGRDTAEEKELIAGAFRSLARADLAAIVVGRSKLIRGLERETLELYDLETDPGELENLASVRVDLLRILNGRLQEEIERRRRLPRHSTEDLDEKQRRELLNLGYLGN